MRIPVLVIFCLLVTSVHSSGSTPPEVADRIGLVPTPREIVLTADEIPTDEISIVAPTDRSLVKTGVEEINDRIASWGDAPRPVSTDIPEGDVLLIAPCDTPIGQPWAKRLHVSKTSPGPQGYAIGVFHQEGRTCLAAVGSDDQGTLYAAMTVRRLLEKRDNRVVLRGASVRDWPAFQRRCLGTIGRGFRGSFHAAPGEDPKAAYVDSWKAYIRFLARHKINMANLRVPNSMGDDVRRELMQYGRRYGLKYRYIFGTAINQELEATGTPWTDCVTRKEARHCWTAFEAHRLKAERISQHVQDMGYDYVVLHVTDSGGLPDPEKWSERCARCRAHYGDDQARAVADQLALYCGGLKGKNPDVLFEAVLQPYHFQWATEAFERAPLAWADDMPHYGHTRGMQDAAARHAAVERATAIHRTTAERLPDDVLVTFREAGRAEFEGCAALWPNHPIDIWVYYGRNEAWQGLWEPQVRFTKTWLREDAPGDLLFNAPVGRPATVNEIYAAGAAEYAWNAEQPDAEPTFEIPKRRYETGGCDVSAYQRASLLPRLCRRLWGRSGDALLPLFANNVSFNYISDPATVASLRGENFDDVYKYWRPMTALLEKTRTAVNEELARIDAGEPSGVYGDLRSEPGYTSFLWLYYYTNLAAVKGRIESAVLDIEQLVAEDELAEAKARAVALQDELPRWIAEVDAVKERLRDEPHVPYRPRTTTPLSGSYFDEAPERIATLLPKMLQNARLGAIPEHLQERLARRTIEVAKVEFRNPFEADGARGEGGWTNSAPVEFFTVAGRDSLARYPTRAWIVWDDNALSIVAEMIDDPSSKAVAGVRDRDGALFEDDCFEVFLQPSRESDDYYHFAVNAAGATYDSIGRRSADEWNPDWQAGASRRTGRWSAEMRIPFDVLGGAPREGDAWHINLGRTRAPKPRSSRREVSSIIDAPSHHNVAEFGRLVFRTSGVTRPRPPVIELVGVSRRDATVTYGFATLLAVRPAITAWVQATDVHLTVEVFDGERRLATESVDLAVLPGYWESDRVIDLDLGDVVRGELRVVLSAVSADKVLDTRSEFRVHADGTSRRAD